MSLNTKYQKLLKSYDKHCERIAQCSSVNINESVKDKYARKKRLEADYIQWFEYYFPMYAKSPSAPFHKKLAKIITNNKVVNLLAEIYRSGAKSVHLDMGIPMFLYIKGEIKFMLLVGQTVKKANKLISDIQAQMQYNQRFINDYGRKYKFGGWAEGDFTTTDGSKFMALGFGQSPRGLREGASRPDYIVVDDIDSKKRCNNDRLSREAYEWTWEDLIGTFEEGSEYMRFVVANNNFHKNTVINQLKKIFTRINKEAKEFGDKIEHFIVKVNAVKDLTDFEPSWKSKTDSDYWRRKYRQKPYRSFMREYMNTHIMDGTVFQHKQLQKCKMLTLGQYDSLIIYGDMSYKDKGDYKALGLVGKKGKDFHLIDALCRQTSRVNTAKWLYDVYEARNLHKYNIRYMIEGLFAQDELVNDFDEEGALRGYTIPVTADRDSKPNKFDRIESMSGYFERGNMWFNQKIYEGTDFENIKDQLLAFEKGSGAADDGPDMLQSAITKLNTATFVDRFEPRIVSRRSKISKNRY